MLGSDSAGHSKVIAAAAKQTLLSLNCIASPCHRRTQACASGELNLSL